MKWLSFVLVVFLAVVSCGPASSSSSSSSPASSPSSALRSYTKPAAFGAASTWWSAVDRAVAQGTTAADNGYPVGLVYRFTTAVTITGVRFYCTGGGTQTFTVHAASSIEPGVSQAMTGLASKDCTSLAAGAVHTCSFTTPVSITNLSLVYTASVYGGSGIADCVQVNTAPYAACTAGAAVTCPIGPSVWLESQGAVYGTFHDSTSLPSTSDGPRLAAAEFVFTVP